MEEIERLKKEAGEKEEKMQEKINTLERLTNFGSGAQSVKSGRS